MPDRRFATVAIMGKPNVGKSTLLNALVGEKLAITSDKPQATREPVVGILTRGDAQFVFVDQPGLMDPSYLLHEAMRRAAISWVKQSDMILYLHPAGDDEPPAFSSLVPELRSVRQPVAVVRSMADKTAEKTADLEGDPPVFWVSARTRAGIEDILEWCHAQAPVRPWVYEDDDITSQPQRFFVTEFVREAAFELLGQELPYSLAAEVDEFREGSDPLYIRVTIYVERETQKRMVIGKHGRKIKMLGASARAKIEELFEQRVYLDLWVKTLPKWRSKPGAVARFGFAGPDASSI